MSTFKLAEVGRPGQQVDPLHGGDVSSDDGRLLSVAELRDAMAIARNLAADAPVDGRDPGGSLPYSSPRVRRWRQRHNQEPFGESTAAATSAERIPSQQTVDQKPIEGTVGLGKARPTVANKVLGLFGGRQLTVSLEDRKTRRAATPTRLGSSESSDQEPWAYLTKPPREAWHLRASRWSIPFTIAIVLVLGLLTIVRQVVVLVAPPAGSASGPAVPEVVFPGTAQSIAVDFLTWDAAQKDVRDAAVSRWGLPSRAVDGWNGSGVLTADTGAAVSVLRGDDDSAVVTVRVRVTTAALAGSFRWLFVAVPLELRGGVVAAAATPALVGSPPSAVLPRAVPSTAEEDTAIRDATSGTIEKLLIAYAAGDLEFTRGPGSDFSGLDGAVTGGRITAWRVAKPAQGGDPNVRDGDVTVLWSLPDGAGSVLGFYRVRIVNTDDRWLLADISPELEPLP